MFEFSNGDISTERAVLGGQRHTQNSSAENSRISYVEEEAVIKGFNFRDDRLLNKKWIYRSNLSDVTMFFRVMALCHTGIPVEEDDQTHKLKYEAESPEEVSFLIAAQEFGFQFFRRSQSVMFLREFDPSTGNEVERKYKLLNLLEFCSARKRMSVIVSNEEGQIFLLCKALSLTGLQKMEGHTNRQQLYTFQIMQKMDSELWPLPTGNLRLLSMNNGTQYLRWPRPQ
ncbi:unnamed protein product [Prunus armeniaca]|uniref:Uncharacterized protein n=1 Tax=Prunus armeniaca TaxID=36596 RepID=A0A6J5X3B2_PRUAR|nr:unnamed protein product [Prunus armeniaca]